MESTEGLSEQAIANMFNSAFVEPLKSFQRLESIPPLRKGTHTADRIRVCNTISTGKVEPTKGGWAGRDTQLASKGVC